MRGRPQIVHITAEFQDFLLFGSRTCIECKVELPDCADFFVVDRSRADGLKGICLRCNAIRERGRYAMRTAAP